jgi:hypothetical protein
MRKLVGLPLALTLAGCGSSSPTAPAPTPTPVPIVSFAGTFSGTYTITACGQTGVFTQGNGFCTFFSVGTTGPLSLTLSQNGSSAIGTLLLGQIAIPVTGSVNGLGQLVLNGSTVSNSFNLQLVGWNTSLSGTTLVGSWNTVWTSSLGAGMAQTVQTLSSVVKTSSITKGNSPTHPNQPFETVQDVFEAMRR